MPGSPHPDRMRLRKEWEQVIGLLPPPFLSVRIMEKTLAFEAQCRTHGDLPAQMRRALKRIADAQASETALPFTSMLKPGALLVREWNGRSYQVEVVEDGYLMDGRTWSSLSALAQHITGTHWSGPRFFGLSKAG